jgi:hypothetical protein
MPPRPPSLRGVSIHRRCTNALSMLQPSTCVSSSWNFALASENAMISVGHTKVKSKG